MSMIVPLEGALFQRRLDKFKNLIPQKPLHNVCCTCLLGTHFFFNPEGRLFQVSLRRRPRKGWGRTDNQFNLNRVQTAYRMCSQEAGKHCHS